MDASSLQHSFLAAVALAVAAVPEGLAAVVTIALALGVRRMASEGAIVRRLSAVETLGSTTVIATDKTGTLTLNELRVVDTWLKAEPGLARRVAALCNDAVLEPPSGDPLEVALLRWVGEPSLTTLRSGSEIVERRPFDSDRKLMSVRAHEAGSEMLLVKGAPEVITALCGDLSDASDIEDRTRGFARRGLRVLALAVRARPPFEETDLSFVGLIALGDPLRPEAPRACAEAAAAGVRVVMVTGDHPETATAIANAAGLSVVTVVTGSELDEKGFPADPARVDVYARVTPDHKLRLVEALRGRGEVVAVTGDGVNDAPALYRGDIGVAMGRTGTDVAKEAADLVITDDNLATIVDAMREGRGIYENIRKVVEYLVATNLAEVVTVIACLVLFPQVGVPLLPLQLLWINLVTDGLPAVGLGLDPVSPALMQRPPRPSSDGIVTVPRIRTLIGRGVAIAAGSVAVLAIARFAWEEPWPHARAVMFMTLAFAQLAHVFIVRRSTSLGFFKNPWLVAGLLGGALMQVVLVLWPALRDLVGAAPLEAREWMLLLAGAVAPAIVMILVERRRRF